MHTETKYAHALVLGGNDADAFAHAQFASDLRALETGQWQWSAWLDARGRVRAFGHLGRCDDGRLLFLLRSGNAETLSGQLRSFVFRMQVDIQPLTDMHTGAGEASPMHALTARTDGFALGLGNRSLVLSSAVANIDNACTDAFVHADIADGYAWFDSEKLDALLPAALGLYRLGAVSTTKGCYPGQEIVSRLHHLGGHKQHLHHVSGWNSGYSGDVMDTASGNIGWILTRRGDDALVVLRDQALGQQGTPHIVKTFSA